MAAPCSTRIHSNDHAGIVKHEVDDAADRSIDGHLQPPSPASMGLTQERLEHGRLEVIAEVRPAARVEAEAQLAPECGRQAAAHVERRVRLPCLDPAEVRGRDPGLDRYAALAESRVDAGPEHLLPESAHLLFRAAPP